MLWVLELTGDVHLVFLIEPDLVLCLGLPEIWRWLLLVPLLIDSGAAPSFVVVALDLTAHQDYRIRFCLHSSRLTTMN
tara:strand:- start:69 stop:302 length:234 start_codon:yes stop_codon:yes gene_type:complete